MSKSYEDQAAGLRRLMTSPQPRILSIISAAQTRQSRLMTNLAASICCDGSDVLIVQTKPYATDVELKAPLVDFINEPVDTEKMSITMPEGYSMAALLHQNQDTLLDDNTNNQLNLLFSKLAMEFQIVLVETALNEDQKLPLKILNESQIVIQLTSQPEDIKQAYQIIKQIAFQHLASNIGKRPPLGILVTETNEAKAKLVYQNISQVAKRYLKLDLDFIGVIPQDESLSSAAKLGRSVINVFPMAQATAAFKSIASKLDYRTNLPSNLPFSSNSYPLYEGSI